MDKTEDKMREAFEKDEIDNHGASDFSRSYYDKNYYDNFTVQMNWRNWQRAWNAALKNIPEGYKLLKNSTESERSWSEDFSHENGMYFCTCWCCQRKFTGHKRRVICKVCAEQEAKNDQ